MTKKVITIYIDEELYEDCVAKNPSASFSEMCRTALSEWLARIKTAEAQQQPQEAQAQPTQPQKPTIDDAINLLFSSGLSYRYLKYSQPQRLKNIYGFSDEEIKIILDKLKEKFKEAGKPAED